MVQRNFYECMQHVQSGSKTMQFTSGKLIYSEAQCYSILFFIMLPLFNLSVLSCMVAFEVKNVGLRKKSLIDPKTQVIFTLIVLQVLIFIHYSMAEDVSRIFFETLEDGCRTVCFFLMMNFFVKQASGLLRNRRLWIKIYKILWRTFAVFLLISIIWMIIQVHAKQMSDVSLCTESSYVSYQFVTLTLLSGFAILGLFITIRAMQQGKAKTKREEKFRQKH